jgi:uncharacterized Tic20 family protein
MVTPEPTLPPPGWYVDPDGRWRWWDGHGWTDIFGQPDQGGNRVLAVVAQLGPILLSWVGFIVPLAVLLAEKDDRFVRHHASESLNFQLSVLLVVFGSGAFFIVVGPHLGAWAALIFIWFVVIWCSWIGFPIFAAVRAGQGRWWSYPVTIRFVRGRAEDPALVRA